VNPVSGGGALATILERLRDAAARAAAFLHSLLGIALGGGVAGLAVGVFLPVPAEPFLPQTAPALNRLVAITSGGFFGWWLGLLGGIVFLSFRRRRP